MIVCNNIINLLIKTTDVLSLGLSGHVERRTCPECRFDIVFGRAVGGNCAFKNYVVYPYTERKM